VFLRRSSSQILGHYIDRATIASLDILLLLLVTDHHSTLLSILRRIRLFNVNKSHVYIYICVCVCIYIKSVTHNTSVINFIHSFMFQLYEALSGLFQSLIQKKSRVYTEWRRRSQDRTYITVTKFPFQVFEAVDINVARFVFFFKIFFYNLVWNVSHCKKNLARFYHECT
jgi:hypothetical protein